MILKIMDGIKNHIKESKKIF